MDRRKICSKKLNSTYLFSHEFYSCQVSPAAKLVRHLLQTGVPGYLPQQGFS